MDITADKYFSEYSGIVTICGSTKYFFEAMECNRRLTFNNWIVLACGSWGHSMHKYSENINTDYNEIKTLHFHKIQVSDAIVVVFDDSGYTGSSTIAETKFADYLGKPIFYFKNQNFLPEARNISHSPLLRDNKHIESFKTLNNGLGF